MALWLLNADAEQDLVTLTYFERLDAPNAQDLGRSPMALLDDVEAWCVDQMTPWDRLRTRAGEFVRQTGTTRRM